MGGFLVNLALSTPASGLDGVTVALKSSFTSVGDSLMGVISDILPIALPVVAAVMVITMGIKIFKKITSK